MITTNLLEQSLNEKQRKSLERTKQEGYLAANTIKEIDVEKVKTMQDLGLHFGELVKESAEKSQQKAEKAAENDRKAKDKAADQANKEKQSGKSED